jgi:elongation factor P
MTKASEFKRGTIVSLNDQPHVVEDLQVQTPSARGGASLYKVRLRNLVSKQKQDQTLRGEDEIPSVDVQRREVQYSYSQESTCVFMDLEDYSEYSLNESDLDHEMKFLAEGLEGITALLSEGRILAIELPDVVELEVIDCEPSARGATAAARTKPATLSTGLVVHVPEYMEPHELVRVDTRTSKYLSRA